MSDNKSNIILEFDGVFYRDAANMMSDLSDCSFSLNRGELMFLLMEKHNTELPLPDLAQGLLLPSQGRVCFDNESWSDMTPYRQSQCRGRIGRVFEHRSWISNLNVYDNIVLGRRYHTDSSEYDLRNMVESLTSRLDLPTMQENRPDNLRPSELKRYEWVRVFLGKPDLLLLYEPEEGVRDVYLKQLMILVNEAITAGTAVLWITTDERLIGNNNLQPAAVFHMSDDKILSSTEGKYA